MRRIFPFPAITALAISLSVVSLSSFVSAMPNYARESGASCFSCHTQPAKDLDETALLANSVSDSIYSTPISNELNTGISIHTLKSDSVWTDISRLKNGTVAKRYFNGNGEQRESDGFTGLSGYLNSDSFVAGFTVMRPSGPYETADDNDSDFSLWYRLAYTPKLGGLNVAVGVFGTSTIAKRLGPGKLENSDDSAEPESYGMDAKIAGQIGDVTLDLKAMYLNSESQSSLADGSKRLLDVSDGFSAAAQVGIKRLFGLSAAYRTYKKVSGNETAQENVASIGAWINIADNMRLASRYTAFGIDKNYLTEDGVFTLLFISSF